METLAGSSAVHQWAGAQNTPYLDPNHNAGMLPAPTAGAPNPAIDPHTGMVHDPDMLQAAQLLLPGDYRPTGMFLMIVVQVYTSLCPVQHAIPFSFVNYLSH